VCTKKAKINPVPRYAATPLQIVVLKQSAPPSPPAEKASTSHPLGRIIRLIDDGRECNFLDKAVVGGRRFGD
jgi:hypothetical protein